MTKKNTDTADIGNATNADLVESQGADAPTYRARIPFQYAGRDYEKGETIPADVASAWSEADVRRMVDKAGVIERA